MAHAFGKAMLATIAAGTALAAVQAAAQDVVVMRRVIAPPARQGTPTPTPTPTPAPTPTPTPTGTGPQRYYNWSVSPWTGGQACAASSETRTVLCQRDDGVSVDEAFCSSDNSGPKPVSERFVASSCSFSWDIGQWSEPTDTCGTSTETRPVACLRSDGVTQTDDACATLGAKPATSQAVSLTTGCGYAWKAGDWGATAPACGASSQSRTVTCQRSDGATIDDSLCPSGAKPPVSQIAQDFTTCTYSWVPGTYGPPSVSCGDATETRPIACVASNGDAADDSKCAGPKPSATTTSHETSGCPFTWATGDYGAVVPGCGATVQNRTVTCLRGDGQPVSDDSCKAAKPDTSKPATDYSTCTFAWVSGVYSDPTTTCGDTTQTRSVTCQRADGSTVAASNCDPATQPATTLASHQVSGCSFSWVPSGFGAPTPACGASTQSQTVSCQRADGQTATDADCSGAGPKPPLTQATTDYGTCSYAWSYGQYGPPSTTCGQATSTRTATCTRSDGTVVATGCSSGDQQPLTQTSVQTSGCTFSWIKGDYGAPAPACGASTQTRSVSCQRSDGQPASSEASCTDPRPSTSQATTDYTTCSYQWVVGNWQGSSSTCGETITQNRSVQCQRSTGDFVDGSFCAGSTPPPSTQTISDFSSCTYGWRQTPGAWTATCSPSATRTNTVSCIRSDGANVSPNGDSFCDAASKPSTRDVGNLAGCTYAWNSTPGAWSSTCSTSATRPETVVCQRSGDSGTTTVPDASCSSAGAKPPSQDVGNLSGCTFSWAYSAYTAPSSTCGASTQTRTASCLRSDGTTMPDNSQCQATLGAPQALTLSTYQTSGCTYTPSYSYAVCTPNTVRGTSGTQAATVTSCLRSDGQQVDKSTQQCNQNTAQASKSCTLSYVGTYSSTYGACTPTTYGQSTGTQTAPITACTMNGSDGSSQPVSADYCPNQTTSQSCSGITYAYNGTYTPYSTCSNFKSSAPLVAGSCQGVATWNGTSQAPMGVADSNCAATNTVSCATAYSTGFESGDSAANMYSGSAVTTTKARTGTSSLLLPSFAPGKNPFTYFPFTATAGVTYNLTMYVWFAGGTSGGAPHVYYTQPNGNGAVTDTGAAASSAGTGGAWVKYTASFKASSSGGSSFSITGFDNNAPSYVDDVLISR